MDGMTASQTVSSPCSPVRRDEMKPHGVTVGYLEGRGGGCNVGHARASFVGATHTDTHTHNTYTHTHIHTLLGLLFSLGLRCDPVPTTQPILLPNCRSDKAPARRSDESTAVTTQETTKRDDEMDAGPPSLSCGGDAKPSTALYFLPAQLGRARPPRMGVDELQKSYFPTSSRCFVSASVDLGLSPGLSFFLS